jgi:hypothetical protein
MAKRKRKQILPGLPRANSAATPPGPWSVVTWSAVEPHSQLSAVEPQTVAELQPPRRRKGPAPGTVNRYEVSDRKLYPELEQRAAPEKCGSITAAAIQMAQERKVAGTGTPNSMARRLARRYFRDHQ